IITSSRIRSGLSWRAATRPAPPLAAALIVCPSRSRRKLINLTIFISSSTIKMRANAIPFLSCRRWWQGGQAEEKDRSAARRALKPDSTAVQLYQRACDAEAKASATGALGYRVVDPIEAREQLLLMLWRDPDAVVGHADDQPGSFGRVGRGAPRVTLGGHIGMDANMALIGGIFVCVADQVGQNLRQPIAIGPDRWQIRRQIDRQRLLLAAEQRPDGVGDQVDRLGQVQRLRVDRYLSGLNPRRLQNIVGDRYQLVGTGLHDFEKFSHLGRDWPGVAFQNQVGEALDRG